MILIFIVLGLVLFFACLLLFGLVHLISKPAENAPSSFMKKQSEGDTLVACIGDSITHGRIGFDWVQHLSQHKSAAGYRFINAGINGHVSHQVNQRLDTVLQHSPDIAVLLIGTNDVMGAFNVADGLRYQKVGGLEEPPTFENFKAAYSETLRRLSVVPKVAVCTVPPLGEVLDSPINQQVQATNAWIRQIAKEKGIPVLPLYEQLETLLNKREFPIKYAYSAVRHTKLRRILSACFGHYFLGQRWDECGKKNGQYLIFDHIHLGEQGAGVLAELVNQFIDPTSI